MSTRRSTARHVTGTGFIVLDVTLAPDDSHSVPPVWAGGTCGNVLSILAFLGWNSKAIGRIGVDAAGACLVRDLIDSGVDVRHLEREAGAATPIVVHRITRSASGALRHGYALACPQCDRRYPAYRPVLVSTAAALAPAGIKTDVFFFDRVSRGVLDLATCAHAAGAFVVFEPAASTEIGHFIEAARLAHVLKYAHDRRPKFADALGELGRHRPWLEIETLGDGGLSYRMQTDRRWYSRPARSVTLFRDAAGAGDWLTAGFLHSLAEADALSAAAATREHVEHALGVGEALAAFNCQFEGPRGAMYASAEKPVSTVLLGLVDARTKKRLCSSQKRPSLQMTLTGVCTACISVAKMVESQHDSESTSRVKRNG